MKLYILRHGEAEAFASSDRLRQLTVDGRRQVRKLAQLTSNKIVRFDAVIVSPYIRAQQTAEIFLDCFDAPSCAENSDLITPDSNPQVVIDLLAKRVLESILLVSHQPLVGRLLELLVDGNRDNGRSNLTAIPPMLTSSLAYLTTAAIVPGCAKLHWVKSPPEFI